MQNMKVENLKHPFILEAIVAICGEIFNKKVFFWQFLLSPEREFVTEYSFLKSTFWKMEKIHPKKKSLGREHFSLSVMKSGCTCHPLLFSESHVYNWSHLLEQCVETWRFFWKKLIDFWRFFWGRKGKSGQNIYFLKSNSPNGETLPKKEKLGQIRGRERERELIPKVNLHAY